MASEYVKRLMKRSTSKALKTQDILIAHSKRQVMNELRKAVDKIIAEFDISKSFKKPDLDLEPSILFFYASLLETAQRHASDEIPEQKGLKRLAKAPPKRLPSSIKDLEEFFRDRRGWRAIRKRAKSTADRLQKQYLNKLKRKFNQLMPKIASGDLTPAEAKAQMIKSFNATESRVQTIFQTESANYFSRVQVAYFEDDDQILGFLFDAVKDVSTTEICRSRHGLVYRPGTELLRKNSPACHWNCRSHLIPLANTIENRKLLADPSRDPAKKKVVPLPRGWSK